MCSPGGRGDRTRYLVSGAPSSVTDGTTQTFTSASISVAEVNGDGVEAEFLERALQPHLVGGDVEIVALQGVGHFRRADRAVQMPFVVGVGFDRDALPRQVDGQRLQAGQAGLLDGVQLGPMLLDHPLVVVGGDGGQSLRQQVVEA